MDEKQIPARLPTQVVKLQYQNKAEAIKELHAKQKNILWSLFLGLIVGAFGVILPLIFFFLSGLLIPEWKGAAKNGWIDCFVVGKVWLSPLVVMAVIAFCTAFRRIAHTDIVTVLGVFIGAMVSTGCAIMGLISMPIPAGPLLLVPLYTATWYSYKAFQLISRASFKLRYYVFAILATIPFWVMSVISSMQIYDKLPTTSPQGCFVVTAAGRGHRRFVGPFCETEHDGQLQLANAQLMILWAFEKRWEHNYPRSHRMFRTMYNCIGPMVAAKIRSPWMADLVYVAIKPVEWMARICVGKDC